MFFKATEAIINWTQHYFLDFLDIGWGDDDGWSCALKVIHWKTLKLYLNSFYDGHLDFTNIIAVKICHIGNDPNRHGYRQFFGFTV